MRWKIFSALSALGLVPQILFFLSAVLIWLEVVTSGNEGGFYPNSGTLLFLGAFWFPVACIGTLLGWLGLFFARRGHAPELIPRILRNVNLLGILFAILAFLSAFYAPQLSRILD